MRGKTSYFNRSFFMEIKFTYTSLLSINCRKYLQIQNRNKKREAKNKKKANKAWLFSSLGIPYNIANRTQYSMTFIRGNISKKKIIVLKFSVIDAIKSFNSTYPQPTAARRHLLVQSQLYEH